MGIGVSSGGDDKALEAVKVAVSSPLLETTINGATDVIINFSGDVTLNDVEDAVSYVQDLTGADTNIIFGTTYDSGSADTVKITVIATGIEETRPAGRPGFGRPVSTAKPPMRGVAPGAGTGVIPGIPSGPAPRPAGGAPVPQRVQPRSINIPGFLKNNNVE